MAEDAGWLVGGTLMLALSVVGLLSGIGAVVWCWMSCGGVYGLGFVLI